MNRPTMPAMAETPFDPSEPTPTTTEPPALGGRRDPGGCRAVAMPMIMVVGLVMLIVMGFSLFTAKNPGRFVASVLVEQLGQTHLPDDQKDRIATLLNDVERRHAAGGLTDEQVNAVGQAIFSDAGINAALLYYVTLFVMERNELGGEDREADVVALQRLTRGVIEGGIDGEVINRLAPRISNRGRPKPSTEVSDDDFAALVEEATLAADTAGVPDEPYAVDAAALFEAAIARGLGGGPAGSGDAGPDAGAQAAPASEEE